MQRLVNADVTLCSGTCQDDESAADNVAAAESNAALSVCYVVVHMLFWMLHESVHRVAIQGVVTRKSTTVVLHCRAVCA